MRRYTSFYTSLILTPVLLLTACGGGGSGGIAPAAAATPSTTTGATGLPGGDVVAGTANAALVKSYALTFRKGSGSGCGTKCSYTEGQSITVVLAADGSIQIDALKLNGPGYYRKFGGVANTAELIWLDGANKIEYALSNNQTPVFNEVNVGDASGSTYASTGITGFMGQIR